MSRPRYVALLRAITNVPMKPFRRALEELGFTDVESYATSGNLLFNARASDPAALERRIAARLPMEALEDAVTRPPLREAKAVYEEGWKTAFTA